LNFTEGLAKIEGHVKKSRVLNRVLGGEIKSGKLSKTTPKALSFAEELAKLKGRLKKSRVLNHILRGEIKSGKALGFHSKPLGTRKGRVVKIIGEPNKFGVYKAEVEVFNQTSKKWVKKVDRGGDIKENTMFPNNWSNYDIIKAINEAFENKIKTDVQNVYEGMSKSGMKVEMVILDGKIVTSYPVY